MQAKKRQALEADDAKCAKLPNMFIARPPAGVELTIATTTGQSLEVEVEVMDKCVKDMEEYEGQSMQTEERLEVEGLSTR